MSHTIHSQVLSRQPGKDTIQLKTVATGQASELIFIITLTATDPANPLRALRVLPAVGGICAGNPFKHVAGAAACNPSTLYRSYVNAHAEILFMPQFLAGLRPYRWAGRQAGMAGQDDQGKQAEDQTTLVGRVSQAAAAAPSQQPRLPRLLHVTLHTLTRLAAGWSDSWTGSVPTTLRCSGLVSVRWRSTPFGALSGECLVPHFALPQPCWCRSVGD